MFCCGHWWNPRNLACAVDSVTHALGVKWRGVCDWHDRVIVGD